MSVRQGRRDADPAISRKKITRATALVLPYPHEQLNGLTCAFVGVYVSNALRHNKSDEVLQGGPEVLLQSTQAFLQDSQ